MAKGAIDRYTVDQLGSCADFEDDITSVVITHTAGDGWMGEYLKMYRDDKVFICPLGKWVETESPEVEFPCYKGLMRCSLMKLKHVNCRTNVGIENCYYAMG